MLEISVTNWAGEATSITVAGGISLMEALRDSGYDEIMALCGGCCSCATCHVYIDIPDNSLIPAMSADENELLESSEYRRANSRLSCQVRLSDGISRLNVTIVPEG